MCLWFVNQTDVQDSKHIQDWGPTTIILQNPTHLKFYKKHERMHQSS